MTTFKGNRWYKCDFHLHTIESKCFYDRQITPKQWIQSAIDQGLNCVAVTDHNTGTGIDAIKQAAEGTNIIVFPGVEITCDTSKIHLLILFDVNKNSQNIEDFLVKCDIKREDFGTNDAFTSKNIFDTAEMAHKEGCLIIPAHIDEYNGLSISHDNIKKLFDIEYINAVQIVHEKFLAPKIQINDELKEYLKQCHSKPIDDSMVKEWYTPVKLALEHKKAILTFSDNPHELNSPKHGLLGIGRYYTWIKMDENPTLESLRQALLLPDFRVRNCFSHPDFSYKYPELWIKSIKIVNTAITEGANPFIVEFSPQLTTVIGGRGSGKSSILRFLRGVFNRTEDISELPDILKDHNDFYKIVDNKAKGVLKENSEIEVIFIRNDVEHRITANKIEKLDPSTKEWDLIIGDGYKDFFKFEQYSQKQIYEIAQQPNSLIERIDKAINGLDEIKRQRGLLKSSFIQKFIEIEVNQKKIAGKDKLQTEIQDIEDRINIYHKSNIAQLLKDRDIFIKQEQLINKISKDIDSKENLFDELIKNIDLSEESYDIFEGDYKNEIENFAKEAIRGIADVKYEIIKLKEQFDNIRKNYNNQISNSLWQRAYNQNLEGFNNEKEQLRGKEVDDIEKFEKLNNTKIQKENELSKIVEIERTVLSDKNEMERLRSEFLSKSKEITQKRRDFVEKILKDEKVRIKIKPFRNQSDFEKQLRIILQRDSGFDRDIECLRDICFKGNIEKTINDVRDIFRNIRSNKPVSDGIKGYFKNLVSGLNDEQLAEIELLLPEDEIEVEYKTSGSKNFKPLSIASAGQKTTAILTFILSHGDIPLILDQPEDDLDNKLVYELIVDRLRRAKENRQLIVVTHNANIPVNGDADYIISMDSESIKLKISETGSVDQKRIKDEICAVMEGGEDAFEMRSKRYKQIC